MIWLVISLIGNWVKKVSRSSLQNYPEAITNVYDKEIAKEGYICPE